MMESVEAWLNDWINKYYANRKPFWVPDYTYLISKEQLMAICSGEIIADEEDLLRRIPNWDSSILGPELQFFIKLRDAHTESKRPAPRKRRGTGAVQQAGRRKRPCRRNQLLPYEAVLDLDVTNAEASVISPSRRPSAIRIGIGDRTCRPELSKPVPSSSACGDKWKSAATYLCT